jgi:uncharacterized protein DUF1848
MENFRNVKGKFFDMNIISASRRTDIPHYFTEWFKERRKAGFAEYRTVFGGGKNGKFHVSLKSEDVLGYLFWTKFAAPFHEQLEILRAEGVPYVFQYTLTGYGKEIQPGIPERAVIIDDFLRVSASLPAAAAIQWRYDPILVSSDYSCDWHRRNFEMIADQLQGTTRVVNVSFIEPYLKALTKAPDWRAIRWRRPDPVRHKTALSKYPGIHSIGAEGDELLSDLTAVARKRGIELRICCNQEYGETYPTAACCGFELFQAYGADIEQRIAALASGPSRPGCRCLKTVDIGMDTTCPGGCFYCYVTTSIDRAQRNFQLHDPKAPMMR